VKVTAAVVERANAPFVLEEVELGELRSDEVLVEIAASGVCHTDLGAQAGFYPTPLPVVLGHEGAGTVVAVGADVTRIKVSDRVAMSYDSCGHCATCAARRPSYCHEFFPRNFLAQRLDGTTTLSRPGADLWAPFFGQSSFATHAICHELSVVTIADDIPFEIVAPFGCGIQTGAGSVLNALAPDPGATIAIVGVGGVGLSAVMGAKIAQCATIIAIDLDPPRLALATELGATHTINAGATDVREAIEEISPGGVPYVLECSGSLAALRQSIAMLGPAGVCGIIGAPPFGSTVDFDVNEILAAGRTIRGIVEGESIVADFIPKLVDLWRDGHFPVDRLVTTFPFDQINEAAGHMHRGTAIKPVLLMS
jgi:aryl-alcohol dehydrogenase